jgi:hypothetical protein
MESKNEKYAEENLIKLHNKFLCTKNHIKYKWNSSNEQQKMQREVEMKKGYDLGNGIYHSRLLMAK